MYDSIIIGAGPSGMSAALNLLRSGRSVLLIEKESIGGQIATSPRVENLPSIKSISGLDFADQLFDQISDLGVEFELENITAIEKKDNYFIVKSENNEFEGKTVIIANGVTHRKMNLPKEEEFSGKGISYCAVCDGAFYKGQDVYLIGDANTALQYALLLANYCNHVYMFALFDKLFADKILIDRLLSTENITLQYNMSLIEYKGEDKLEGLVFQNTKTKETSEYVTNNVFIAIGQLPNNAIYKNVVELNEKGFIVTNNNMETKTPGIYAIGDTRVKDVRQVATAVNDGSIAAVFVDRYLRG